MDEPELRAAQQRAAAGDYAGAIAEGRSWAWKYVRGSSSDPTIGRIDTLGLLTGALPSLDRGALRRPYDDIDRGTG